MPKDRRQSSSHKQYVNQGIPKLVEYSLQDVERLRFLQGVWSVLTLTFYGFGRTQSPGSGIELLKDFFYFFVVVQIPFPPIALEDSHLPDLFSLPAPSQIIRGGCSQIDGLEGLVRP